MVFLKHVSKLPFFLLLTAFMHSSYADNESLENIKKTTLDFIHQHIQLSSDEKLEVKVNEASIAFQVPACQSRLEASLPTNSNHEALSSVEIACNDAAKWRIFVPVEVKILTNVIVAKHTIASKTTLSEEDIDFMQADRNRLYNGFFTKKDDVIGDVANHLIPAGTVLTKKNLQLPYLVLKNQAITLVSQHNAVIVTMQGIARTDGTLNATIKVFNPSSKKIVDAIVTGPNKAQVIA